MTWTCLRCESVNAPRDTRCAVCDLERLYTAAEVAAQVAAQVAAARRPVVRAAGRTGAARRPGYGLALLHHALGGFGIFYIDGTLRRRWLYPLLFSVAVVLLVLGGVQGVAPFDSEAGAVAFLVSAAAYGLGVVDVWLTCRQRRRRTGMG